MKRLAVLLAASTAIMASVPAVAGPYIYNFTGSRGSVGSIYFTTPGSGAETPNFITGTINGTAITGLSPYAAADNVFDPAVPHFSFGGLSVSTTGGIDYNFYYDGTGDKLLNSVASPGGFPGTEETLTEVILSGSAVPEPATWAMMVMGFGMVGFGLRGRRKQSVRVTYA